MKVLSILQISNNFLNILKIIFKLIEKLNKWKLFGEIAKNFQFPVPNTLSNLYYHVLQTGLL